MITEYGFFNQNGGGAYVPNFEPEIKPEILAKCSKEMSPSLFRGTLRFKGRTNCASEEACDILENLYKDTYWRKFVRFIKKKLGTYGYYTGNGYL